jgi:stage II sporulation protein D
MTFAPPTSPSIREGVSGRRAARRLAARAAALLALATTAFCAGAALAPAPASATVDTLVSLVGHGWGHGIGMSQWGAYGYALHGYKYQDIIKHYYTGVAIGTIPNSDIRVLLTKGQGVVRVTSASSYVLLIGTAKVTVAANVTSTVTWAGGKYNVTAGSKKWVSSSLVTFDHGQRPLYLFNPNQNGHVGHYRGALHLTHYADGFMVVDVLDLQAYVMGILPYEISPAWPIEAQKAQAVAARSYGAVHLTRHGPYDVTCTTTSQVYNGWDGEKPLSDQAVRTTYGVVPLYSKSPIWAYFFDCSGGHTESIENVWQTTPVPYLKGVLDPYDYYAPRHTWPDNPIRRTVSILASELGAYSASDNPSGVKGALNTIVVLKRGVSPRVVDADILGSKGVTHITGGELRVKLNLRDTWVAFASMSVSPSRADNVVITYGSRAVLAGRLYTALPDGATVSLHAFTLNAERVIKVTTKRVTVLLPDNRRTAYSSYQVTLAPTRRTDYHFSSGAAESPTTRIGVQPALTIAATKTTPTRGQHITISGKITPRIPGQTVTLQTLAGGTWQNTASVLLSLAGTYSIDWVAAAGVTAARIHFPAAAWFSAVDSPQISLSVAGSSVRR